MKSNFRVVILGLVAVSVWLIVVACACHLAKSGERTALTISVADLEARIAVERKYQRLFPFPAERAAAEYHRGRGDSLQDLIQLAKDRAAAKP